MPQVVYVGPAQDYVEDSDKLFKTEGGQVVEAKVKLHFSYTGKEARVITLQFDLPDYIAVDRNPIVIDQIRGGGTPLMEEVAFYGKLGQITGSLEV